MDLPMPENPKAKHFIGIRAVRQRYGDRSHMWVNRKLAGDPDFPKPNKLGGRLRLWDVDELEQWERLCAAREPKSA
jgi:predicted DNA-binding transcriptional regulator AlpA